MHHCIVAIALRSIASANTKAGEEPWACCIACFRCSTDATAQDLEASVLAAMPCRKGIILAAMSRHNRVTLATMVCIVELAMPESHVEGALADADCEHSFMAASCAACESSQRLVMTAALLTQSISLMRATTSRPPLVSFQGMASRISTLQAQATDSKYCKHWHC